MSVWVSASAVLGGIGLLAVGYFWGFHEGKSVGLRLGLASAPLELRAEALATGTCPICGDSGTDSSSQTGADTAVMGGSTDG